MELIDEKMLEQIRASKMAIIAVFDKFQTDLAKEKFRNRELTEALLEVSGVLYRECNECKCGHCRPCQVRLRIDKLLEKG